MIKLHFKCELCSDIVLNASAATSSSASEHLDYIPGNKFLGILAKKKYGAAKTVEGIAVDTVFHSNSVCFSDAHPIVKGKRSLKMPLDFFTDKNDEEKGIYLNHLLKEEHYKTLRENDVQTRQMRKGYFVEEEGTIYKEDSIYSDARFSVKSAYNRNKRRPEKEKMFGYFSLPKGSVWSFYVTLKEEAVTLKKLIIDSLEGKASIGKSTTAEYGRVLITYDEQLDVEGFDPEPITVSKGEWIKVYAASNLCFLDDSGEFTLSPKAEDLDEKLAGMEICWSKTQIRHRLYTSWNGHRKARDADRWIIEKGSVFFIKATKEVELKPKQRVGLFQNEGFGEIIFQDKVFEKALPEGKLEVKNLSVYAVAQKEEKDDKKKNTSPISLNSKEQQIQKYLKRIKQRTEENDIAKEVIAFMKAYQADMIKISSSQWGQLHNFAINMENEGNLKDLLFHKDIGFLNTASRKNTWKRNLVKGLEQAYNDQSKKTARFFIIQLSNEAAKRS